MRYVIQSNGSVLPWLFKQDDKPSAAPVFSDDENTGLVVAYLLNGRVYAEVVPTVAQLRVICGKGFPFGRLFFHVNKKDLFRVCANLSEQAFMG